MLIKTITYKDFNGVERTEKFYFHLSEAELAEMEVKRHGLAEYFQSIVNAQDGEKILEAFKDLIDLSYGVKSEDGRHFRKSKELTDDFKATNAYNALFMELASSDDAAIEFCNGIIPESIRDAAGSASV